MRILIVKLTSLGDVVHTLPAVSDLVKHFPAAHIDWLVEENFQSIPGWHSGVCNVYTAATRRWRRQPGRFVSEIRHLSQTLKRQPYDVIIDAQGLLKSATLTRLAKGHRVGYDKVSIKESAASRFYNQKISVDVNAHAVVRTRRLFAGAFDYSVDESIDYGLSADQFKRAEFESDYLVFLHGTTWESKQWPLGHWQALTDKATRKGFHIMLLWGNESEKIRAQQIAGKNDNALVCPKMNLDQIAGLIAHARGVVAVDTGLGHLAAALSAPCVNLYGATDSARTGTIGTGQKHLQADFECSPCLLKQCNFKGASKVVPACFEQFSADLVWQQLEQSI